MSKAKSTPAAWGDKPRMILDLSIEEYHANRSHLSKTPIAKLLPPNGSPAHFVYSLTAEEDEKEKSAALRVGQAFHLALEGMDNFLKAYHVMPDKVRRAANEQPYKDQVAIAQDREILKESEFEQAVAMAESISCARVLDLFKGYQSVTEPTLAWYGFAGQFDKVGLKYRPDRLCYLDEDDEATVFDWKSARSAFPEAFERSAFDLKYDISVALADEGIRRTMGRQLKHYYFVVVEKEPPNVVTVYDAMAKNAQGFRYLESGQVRLFKALEIYESCRDKGSWPGYSEEVLSLGVPAWELKKLERETED